MKIIVIGASGTIGREVVEALKPRHEVLEASRNGTYKVDIRDEGSVRALFASIPEVDGLVCCAGGGAWKPLAELTTEDFAMSLGYKLMGQVAVVRAALANLRDHGSVTVTSGVLANKPMPGSAAISMINCGLEGFVRAAALEAPRGIRVNVVSPPWAKETLQMRGMPTNMGLSAADIAKAYVAAVEGKHNGETLEPENLT